MLPKTVIHKIAVHEPRIDITALIELTCARRAVETTNQEI
jgi:hypothetical protein